MINVVTALPSEAQPLIEHFGLVPLEAQRPLRVYRGDQIRLVVSGMGKAAASTATGYLAGLVSNSGRAAWLNVGIAGHGSLEVGSCRIADQITDAHSGERHFPSLVFKPPCDREKLTSVDQPETDYHDDGLFDMEASAFFPAAQRFTDLELVHVLKVVSDNRHNPTSALTRGRINELIRQNVSTVERLVENLAKLMADHLPVSPTRSEALLQRWHLSATQRSQLLELERRWSALIPERSIASATAASRDAREAIHTIREHLSAALLRPDQLR